MNLSALFKVQQRIGQHMKSYMIRACLYLSTANVKEKSKESLTFLASEKGTGYI